MQYSPGVLSIWMFQEEFKSVNGKLVSLSWDEVWYIILSAVSNADTFQILAYG